MDIDTTKVLVGIGTTLAKDATKSIITYLPAKLTDKYNQYFNTFSDYIERTSKICSYVRTIINKDKPVDINEIYVKGRFKCGKEVVGDDELCQRIRDGQRVVVSGFGGIGKTIFCKYFWNSLYKNPAGFVPIYCELRSLNEVTVQSLETYIRVSLTYENRTVPEDLFKDMMIAGRFAFILDGFDEIPDANRMTIQTQILKMANMYERCPFLVSSRADDRFSSWLEFHNYAAMDFDKTQSREVINKVDFDKEIKKEFMAEILEKRYDDYKHFFSTPLLTLMMLMTYMQIRYIPDSRHVFYKYAFQTLYTLHDASKQGFQRKRYVEMSESDFTNVFSLFCLISYADLDTTFTYEKLLSYLERVKRRARVPFNPDLFIKECVESVNLLYKDGDQFTFIHRSFQEYFCAYAATHYFPDKVEQVIEQIPVRFSDSVYLMMYSINPDVTTNLFIIPVYKTLQSKFNEILRDKNAIHILSYMGVDFLTLFDAKLSNGRYGYGISYGSDIHHFMSAIVAMFKPEIPFKRKSESYSHGDLLRLTNAIRKLVTGVGRESLFNATFRFSKQELVIKCIMRTGENSDFVKTYKFSELSEIVDIEKRFSDIAKSLRAELVFAKRKCDDLVRRRKEVIRGGDHILAL